jgi:hypothetical protein
MAALFKAIECLVKMANLWPGETQVAVAYKLALLSNQVIFHRDHWKILSISDVHNLDLTTASEV